MNKNLPPELKQKFTVFCNETLEQLAKEHGNSYKKLLTSWQELHTIYLETTAESLEQWAQKYDSQDAKQRNFPDKIEADSVVVELIDNSTRKVFRRDLPIKYNETDNGILLSGETIEGTPSQIAFFSETAINKINDLLGRGPDSPRCGHED